MLRLRLLSSLTASLGLDLLLDRDSRGLDLLLLLLAVDLGRWPAAFTLFLSLMLLSLPPPALFGRLGGGGGGLLRIEVCLDRSVARFDSAIFGIDIVSFRIVGGWSGYLIGLDERPQQL